MKKNNIYIGIIMAAIISIAGFWFYQEPAEKKLEVDFLDVGQGDSILVKTPSGLNILIDGGYDNKVINRLPENMEPWDKQIDLMILTHPHDDHVTGLVEVLNRYKVKKILATGALHTTPNYLAWLKEIRDKQISLQIIDSPQNIDLGDAYLEIIYPDRSLEGKEVENLNNSSIVSRLVYKKTAFLFAGDIEKEIEKYLLDKKIDLRADVMKANHHGSDSSNTESFIKAVNPEYAVFEVGRDNKFNLPDQRIIKRFERLGIKAYRTDYDGTVRFLSDGNKVILANN
jgi:competence protein ComEC